MPIARREGKAALCPTLVTAAIPPEMSGQSGGTGDNGRKKKTNDDVTGLAGGYARLGCHGDSPCLIERFAHVGLRGPAKESDRPTIDGGGQNPAGETHQSRLRLVRPAPPGRERYFQRGALDQPFGHNTDTETRGTWTPERSRWLSTTLSQESWVATLPYSRGCGPRHTFVSHRAEPTFPLCGREVRARLDAPLSGSFCVVGWLLATAVFFVLVRLLGGLGRSDAYESVFSTWAIAHGQFTCAFPVGYRSSLPCTHSSPGRSRHSIASATPCRSRREPRLGPHCDAAFLTINSWSLKSDVLDRTLDIGYLGWFVLMGGLVSLLRASGRGRCGWEPPPFCWWRFSRRSGAACRTRSTRRISLPWASPLPRWPVLAATPGQWPASSSPWPSCHDNSPSWSLFRCWCWLPASGGSSTREGRSLLRCSSRCRFSSPMPRRHSCRPLRHR